MASIWGVGYCLSIYDSDIDGYDKFFSTREKAQEYFDKRNKYFVSKGLPCDIITKDSEFIKEFSIDNMDI